MTDSPAEARQSLLTPASERLQDPKEEVRLAAVAELLLAEVESLPPLETVTPCLDDANHEVRRLAVEVLLGHGPGAVPVLSQALGEQQPVSVRIAAASALARVGPEAAPACESLAQCVQSGAAMVRWHASFALGKIGTPAVEPLRLLLQSSDPRVVAAALDALEWIGPGAKEAQPDVEKLAAETPFPDVRLACATALVQITGEPANAKPVLEELLAKGDPALRKACIQRIAGLGPSGGECRDCLRQACADPAAEVRAAAALALALVLEEPAEAVPALSGLLSDREPEVRANAAMALARYGPAAASALPLLKEMQQQTHERPAAVARAAIEKIEQKAS